MLKAPMSRTTSSSSAACALTLLIAGGTLAHDQATTLAPSGADAEMPLTQPAAEHLPQATQSMAERRGPLRAALIIGNNRSPRGALPDLQYADDDALRTRETLRAVMPDLEVALLTRADDDTARLFGDVARQATPPTRAAVDGAVQTLAARFAEARAAGADTELYVVFSGHGERDQNGGYLELEDGALRRGDLLAMISALKPRRAHVVLDACNSFFVVNARRPGGRPFVMRHEVEAGLAVEGVDVGVLVSTSADAQVYEWSQLSGGIFSHVLRSGLSGAADADGDGVVTYAELEGYMDVAVQDLPNAEYRPRLFMNAPADDRFVTLPDAPILRGAVGHLTVRDARGVRVLDVHPELGFEPRLIVAGAGPFSATRVGPDGKRVTGSLVTDADGRGMAMSLGAADGALAMRGPPLVFDSLFAAAFGPTALEAAALKRRQAPEPVYGLSTAQLQRIALQLRIAGKQARQDRTTTAASAIALGSATFLAASGGTAAILLNEQGVAETTPLIALSPIWALGGAIGAVWGVAHLLSTTDVEGAVAAFDASDAPRSEEATLEAIAVVRHAAHRQERSFVDERDALGISGALSLLVGVTFMAAGAAPALLGRDEPIDAFAMAAGGAYAGLGVGSIALAAYHAAGESTDGEKLSPLAIVLQLIDEDPDGPSEPRAPIGPPAPSALPASPAP